MLILGNASEHCQSMAWFVGELTINTPKQKAKPGLVHPIYWQWVTHKQNLEAKGLWRCPVSLPKMQTWGSSTSNPTSVGFLETPDVLETEMLKHFALPTVSCWSHGYFGQPFTGSKLRLAATTPCQCRRITVIMTVRDLKLVVEACAIGGCYIVISASHSVWACANYGWC